MRLSSSPARQAVISGEGREFVEWSPESLTARQRRASGAGVQAAIDEAVAEATEEERVLREALEAELTARLEAQKEQIASEAFERGYEEGRAEGELAEAARLRTALRSAEEALDTLRAGEIRWTGTIEENVCALAVVIARQIVGRELEADISPVADLVRGALAEFPIDQPIRIRINPSDLNALGSIGAVNSDPLKGITADRDARWLPDASIAPGGCMVEGRERIIDGRVDTALERVYRRITYTNA